MKKKILLMNCPSSISVYSESKIKMAVGFQPFISLTALAAMLLKKDCEVQILDLMLSKNPKEDLISKLKEFDPEFVGITFTTPLFNEAKELSNLIKEYSPKIKIVAGGVHPTILPEDVLKNTKIDIVVIGEGDYTLPEIVLSKNLSKIKGIAYKKSSKTIITEKSLYIEDLDKLPYPAWQLLDVKKYQNPRIVAKKNPVGTIETSRGCMFDCVYCNKSIFSRQFRVKSPRRVINELEYMLRCGFKEIHVWDDNFATNLKRAKIICDGIIKRKLKLIWRLECGIRVDCVDNEFFKKLKEAGCYGVSFGFESGNQGILDEMNKGTTVEQAYNACSMAKQSGLEITGFFMFGLPGETEQTMKDTIEFAKKLGCDYSKVTIVVPFPSTRLFERLEKEGLIKTKDWSKYNFHTASKVYGHPNLSWNILESYYNKFYSEFYFRPKYIVYRIKKGLFNGGIFLDIYYFMKTWFF